MQQVQPKSKVQYSYHILPSESAGWIRIVAPLDEPALKANEPPHKAGEYLGLMEVNITAQVHEVSDPSTF